MCLGCQPGSGGSGAVHFWLLSPPSFHSGLLQCKISSHSKLGFGMSNFYYALPYVVEDSAFVNRLLVEIL